MGCELGPPINVGDVRMEVPQGNTYEITIGMNDAIIIKIQHEEVNHIKSVSKLLVSGVSMDADFETGRRFLRTHFSIEALDNEGNSI